MRSWVFRNRARMEALLGQRRKPSPGAAVKKRPSLAPRVVVLVPVRRA